MESLRRNLLEQIDSLRVEYESVNTILRSLPNELLHRNVGSNWGSIFGILAHATKTQDMIGGWLTGNPRGLHTELEGKADSLDSLAEYTMASNKRMFELVRDEPDLERIVDYWFPDEGDWYRHRFFQVVQLEIHHTCAHRAHAYMIARMDGYELTQNALFYYFRHPPTDAYILGQDKEIYAAGAVSFKASYDLVESAKGLVTSFATAREVLGKRLSEDVAMSELWSKELEPRFAKAQERLSTRLAEADGATGTARRNVLMQVGLEEVDERLQTLDSYLLGENKDLAALEESDIEIRRYDSPNLRNEFGSRIAWRLTGVPKEVQTEAEAVVARVGKILSRLSAAP